MDLKELVPPVELCQKIPPAFFEDSAFCWHYSEVFGFVCRTYGCEQIQDKQWQIISNHRNKIRIRRSHGEEIYPAPTLQEILSAMPHCTCRHSHLGWTLASVYVNNNMPLFPENPAAAALELWLKLSDTSELSEQSEQSC